MATMFPNGVPLPEPKPDRSAAQAGTPLPNSGTPTATPAGDTLRSGWQEFLSHPENRAGLLQFGVSMLAASGSGNTLAQNIGGSLGEGLAARGDAVNTEAATAAAAHKTAREDALANATIDYRRAAAAKARRPAAGKAASTKGELTPKDYTKEWLKFAKDARSENPDAPIAELKAQFNELWGAASPDVGTGTATPAAPAATPDVATINTMTLDQIAKLDVNKLDPATAKVALARYRSLKAAAE